MAELIVSAILPVLFEKLIADELLKFATREGVRSKLKKWEDTLKMIEALLNDAEEKQLKNNRAVKLWLDKLQDLAYDVEDILDEYATEALRRKLKIEEHQASTSRARKLIPACFIGCTPSDLWSGFNMRSKIDEVTSRLEDLYRQRTALGLVEIAGVRSTALGETRDTSSLPSEDVVYGRDQDKANILEMVLKNEPGDANFGVIPIVGMGGIGKTTLIQKVYNDDEVKDFDPKAWVCVSDDFDVLRISNAILRSITRKESDYKELNSVHAKLKEELNGKKFLLVLDDVWSDNDKLWQDLKSPFMFGKPGSKVIVTTRLREVALTMGPREGYYELDRLSDNNCWSLFKKYAFEGKNVADWNEEVIRPKVVQNCKGLPLAARTLGGLLRRKDTEAEWIDILNSKIWDQPGADNVLPVLKLSYNHLPSYLKRCFAYCAIFPKDYEFEMEELVLLWMAEGLIQQSAGDNKQLEKLGGQYFLNLLSRSIFQISSSNNSKYIMHDLVNDLAQKVSEKVSFRSDDELYSNSQSRISDKMRYASYVCREFNHKSNFEVFSEALNLRTHLSMPPINSKANSYFISNTVVPDLLLRFKKLRVLSLQKYYIVELLDSIGDLRLLRYLNLSGSKIRSLPESVNSMCNLQTLILRDCSKLLKWPRNMGNLINLRHFDIKGAYSIEEMPVGIRKWESLRTLTNFIVCKDSKSSLKDLKNLKFLWGELHISKLENAIDLEDILSDKKDLKVLLLKWGSSYEDSRDEDEESEDEESRDGDEESRDGDEESRDEEVEKKVLDMLQPHQNLEKLTIKCYRGTKFSSWVGSSSFSECKMTVLELVNCRKCTSLPSLGLLGSLKSITVKGMNGVKSIGSEFYGEHCSNPFQSLETLYFENLEKWKCWDPVKENESFPKLQELSIVNCPRLSERLPSNLCSLKKLVICRCKQLVVSLPNIPTLCELELDECKKIFCSNSTDFESLESMTLSNISYFGDWSRQEFKKVKSLEIDGCKELIELWQNEIFHEKTPQGLHSLISLRKLGFKNCNTLTTLLEGIKQTNVQVEELRIEDCNSLNFTFRGKLPQSLKKLRIEDCEKFQCLLDDNEDTCSSSSSKFQIPACLLPEENAVNTYTSHLEDLYIWECPALTCLLSTDRLSITLTSLTIWNCSKLTTLSSTGQLPMLLKHLDINSCSELTALLPKGQLPETLETLRISCCVRLEWIVEKFHNNKALCKIDIYNCNNLKSFPEGLHTLSSLRSIGIYNCNDLASFPKGGFPNSNFTLVIWGCDKLEALPNAINTLPSLEIFNCSNMSLSEEGMFTKLKSLSIMSVKQYKALIQLGLHNFTTLTDLQIHGNLEEDEDVKITLPRSLTSLRVRELTELKYLPFKGLEDLSFLESLTIYRCEELISLPSLPSSLSKLVISYCPFLKELTPLSSLPSSLLELEISNCPLLEKACKRDKGKEWLKIADIPCVYIDEKFIYDPEEESEAQFIHPRQLLFQILS